jgi:hypothetical protein
MVTISAFYFGETLQASTTTALSINVKNIVLSAEILEIFTKLSPDRIKAKVPSKSSASLIYL